MKYQRFLIELIANWEAWRADNILKFQSWAKDVISGKFHDVRPLVKEYLESILVEVPKTYEDLPPSAIKFCLDTLGEKYEPNGSRVLGEAKLELLGLSHEKPLNWKESKHGWAAVDINGELIDWILYQDDKDACREASKLLNRPCGFPED